MPGKLKYGNLLIVFGIAVLIALASFIGRNRAQESQKQLIANHFPDSLYNLKQVNVNKWIVNNINAKQQGYIYTGQGGGYNGSVHVLVQTDLKKNIIQVIPLLHHETPSYFKKLEKKRFFAYLSGRKIDSFFVGDPIDAISGATASSIAVMQAIRVGYSEGENITTTPIDYPVFGFLEFLVLYLLFAGFIIVKVKNIKLKRYLLWISIILSFVLLGFIFNQPLTFSRISAILNGYFPSLNKELYLYILLGGSVLFILITRKNIYCHSVCPFGAAQDILAKTGKAKPFRPKYYTFLKILQRTIALFVLLISLALNNPAIAQYEVFGAFFQLTASSILFVVLFIVIILSLFIKRPWCHFMCPIDSVFEYTKLTRESLTGIWKK